MKNENIYTTGQVESTLRNYSHLQGSLGSDIKIDLDVAIATSGLNVAELLAIKMVCAMELSLVEAHVVFGEQLDVNMVDIKNNLDSALEKLTANMNGYPKSKIVNKLNPFVVSKAERQLVATRLAKHDELLKEAVEQTNNPNRKQEIMDNTSDNDYAFHKTSTAIENPNRAFDYSNRLNGGDDYFIEQYVRNGLVELIDGAY